MSGGLNNAVTRRRLAVTLSTVRHQVIGYIGLLSQQDQATAESDLDPIRRRIQIQRILARLGWVPLKVSCSLLGLMPVLCFRFGMTS